MSTNTEWREFYLKTDNGRVRYYGHDDVFTANHTYFFDGVNPYHQAQFEAVLSRLFELTLEHDANGAPVVQLVALRRAPACTFVAYRFTSDWSYGRYNEDVQQYGASLGRGTYKPFDLKGDFDHYYKDHPQ